jgi:hypothetical protein
MHRFAWSDPEPLSGLEPAMFQQTRPPLRASIGHFGFFSQNGTAIAVQHLDLQDSGYNTIFVSHVAPTGDFFPGIGF